MVMVRVTPAGTAPLGRLQAKGPVRATPVTTVRLDLLRQRVPAHVHPGIIVQWAPIELYALLG